MYYEMNYYIGTKHNKSSVLRQTCGRTEVFIYGYIWDNIYKIRIQAMKDLEEDR